MTNSVKADLLLVLVTLLAAISWVFSKEAVLLMPPLLFVATRFLLAGGLLSCLAYRQLKNLSWNQYRQAIIVGSIFAVGTLFWIMGLYSGVQIGIGAFLTSLSIVLVPVMSRLFFKEPQPLSTWLALAIATIGLAFLSLQGAKDAEWGHVLFLLCAVFFSLFFILNMRAANHREGNELLDDVRVSEKVPALPLTAISLTLVGLIAGGLSFFFENWLLVSEQFSMAMLGWVLASALIGTALRFFIQTHAQSLSSQSHGIVIMVVEPVWTALLGAFWFAETMTFLQGFGCALIFISLLINRWGNIKGLFKATQVGR